MSLNKNVKKNSIIILLAMLYIFLVIYNALLAIAVICSTVIFLVFVKKPIWGLGFFIAILPFSNMEIFNYTFGGVQGLKPLNIIVLIVVLGLVISKDTNRLSSANKVFVIVFLLIYVVNYMRSMPYIKSIYLNVWQIDYSMLNYLQNFFLKGFILFLPFVLIIKFIKSKEEVVKLVYSIFFSVAVMSLIILYAYIFIAPDKTDFQSVRNVFGQIFQLHGNELVNFYIITIPVLLVSAIHKKNIYLILLSLISLFIVAILYSRAGYIIILLTIPVLFIAMRKLKYLPVFFVSLFIVIAFMPSIVQRALIGVFESNLDVITAGRLDNIWIPLINELLAKPALLLFGGGQNFIYQTEAFRNNLILSVGHAHNMYLTTIIDSGLISLIFIFSFIAYYLIGFIKNLKCINDRFYKDTQISLIIAVISFLIRGITDGFIFPTVNDTFIWVSLGLGITITNIYTSGKSGDSSDLELNRA